MVRWFKVYDNGVKRFMKVFKLVIKKLLGSYDIKEDVSAQCKIA